jgi:hypothetical protein
VKVEGSQPVRRVKPRLPQPRKIFKNGDLPDGCQTGDAWRRAFIPTYLWWVSTQPDPWCVDEEKAIEAMQEIWDAIYDSKDKKDKKNKKDTKDDDTKIPYVITLNDAVSSVVNKPILFAFILFTAFHRLSNAPVTPGVVPLAHPRSTTLMLSLMRGKNLKPMKLDRNLPLKLSKIWDFCMKILIQR